jgi:UDP-N-acetylmuramate dehydrogenase
LNTISQPALERVAARLVEVLGPVAVRAAQPLARHTTLRVGGPADLLAVVDSAEALRQAVSLAWANGLPCQVLGAGSNVLVSDAGVRGLVILNRAKGVRVSGQRVTAESGATFAAVARQCVARGLAGLEWATGIPGTVGGAVVGNAGAWGGDVASILVQATVLEFGKATDTWTVERFEYGYRTSIVKQAAAGQVEHGRSAVVLEADFALLEGDKVALRMRVAEITARRKASQSAGASCGSVFKNPPGDYAGRLIEAAGLKGQHSGGAQISPTHANFIVNLGGATASDVERLIDLARQAVQVRFGVMLDLEIELIGDWGRRNQ